jgi:hypothetical protein
MLSWKASLFFIYCSIEKNPIVLMILQQLQMELPTISIEITTTSNYHKSQMIIRKMKTCATVIFDFECDDNTLYIFQLAAKQN